MYTVTVLDHFLVTCICQVIFRSSFNLQPHGDKEAMVNDFLSTLRDRERAPSRPLFFSRGEDLGEFVTSRRQQILKILREFQVVFLPQKGLLVDVASYALSSPRVASHRRDAMRFRGFLRIHELTNHSSERGRNASELKRQFSFKISLLLAITGRRHQINQLLNKSSGYICRLTTFASSAFSGITGEMISQ